MFEEIITKLKQQYTIEHVIDVTKCQSPAALFEQLKLAKKEEFADQERVVILIDNSLKRSFDDLPQDIVIQLEKYLVTLDIPHFFVIIISNVASIQEDLVYLQRTYTTEEFPIPAFYHPTNV